MADTVQMTRNAGFMLTKKAADLRKSFFLGVVETEPLFFLGFEAIERSLQGASEERNIAFAMRIGELDRRPKRRRSFIARFVITKFLEATAGTDRIDVPLGKNGAEPGLQGTATMEVTEERTVSAFGLGQTIQIGKKGIREVAGFRRTRRATKNRGRGSAQISAVGVIKMLPGGLYSFGAGGGQSQIFEM